MSIKKRSHIALNTKQYSNKNKPEKVVHVEANPPVYKQYILRVLIKKPFQKYKIPTSLNWCKDIIEQACKYQEQQGIHQPFCYVTIRNGLVESVTDDEWHVDGFSKTVTHLPEQNYVWVDKMPTEYIIKSIKIPKHFNSQKHNLHLFLQDNIKKSDKIKVCKEKTLYAMDPYVIHRRPMIPNDTFRCFVRISFTPIEIKDSNNTLNPLLETNYTRDGVKSFRDKLVRFK